jgi:hypothetical protein
MTSNPLHSVGDYVVRKSELTCEQQGILYPNTYEVYNTVTGVIEYAHPQLISVLTAAELFAFQLERKLYKPDAGIMEDPDLPGVPFALYSDPDNPPN